jgi:hypothetical protein
MKLEHDYKPAGAADQAFQLTALPIRTGDATFSKGLPVFGRPFLLVLSHY